MEIVGLALNDGADDNEDDNDGRDDIDGCVEVVDVEVVEVDGWDDTLGS